MAKAKTTTKRAKGPKDSPKGRRSLPQGRPKSREVPPKFRPTTQHYGIRYPNGFVPPPKQIPVGAILVHNPVTAIHPQQSHGWNGFRFFYMTTQAAKDKHVVRCRCGWAPHLPVHYHPKGYKPAWHVTKAPREEVEEFEKWQGESRPRPRRPGDRGLPM